MLHHCREDSASKMLFLKREIKKLTFISYQSQVCEICQGVQKVLTMFFLITFKYREDLETKLWVNLGNFFQKYGY